MITFAENHDEGFAEDCEAGKPALKYQAARRRWVARLDGRESINADLGECIRRLITTPAVIRRRKSVMVVWPHEYEFGDEIASDVAAVAAGTAAFFEIAGAP